MEEREQNAGNAGNNSARNSMSNPLPKTSLFNSQTGESIASLRQRSSGGGHGTLGTGGRKLIQDDSNVEST